MSRTFPIMHQRLTEVFKKIGCKYEIIFVNDGSPDNSEQVLEEIFANDQSTTAIIHSRNFNSQNALYILFTFNLLTLPVILHVNPCTLEARKDVN